MLVQTRRKTKSNFVIQTKRFFFVRPDVIVIHLVRKLVYGADVSISIIINNFCFSSFFYSLFDFVAQTTIYLFYLLLNTQK